MSRPETAVVLRCEDGERGCGISFVAQARYARKIRDGIHPQLCSRCARGGRRIKPREKPGPAEYRFWFEQFSDDELAMIVSYCFGVRDRTPEIAARRAELFQPVDDRPLIAAGA